MEKRKDKRERGRGRGERREERREEREERREERGEERGERRRERREERGEEIRGDKKRREGKGSIKCSRVRTGYKIEKLLVSDSGPIELVIEQCCLFLCLHLRQDGHKNGWTQLCGRTALQEPSLFLTIGTVWTCFSISTGTSTTLYMYCI